ncbi:MAG: tetratricopeptide repeat protein [Chloroflexales bacterium]|nr:tetratricopeptide repeat protein [Chloroflexales bacterium]
MPNRATSLWGRLLARCWYVWGLSLCYAGGRSHDRSFFQAGVGAFGRAARCWPAFAEAYYQRGTVRGRELGEYQAAVADLERATALSPDWPDPYLQRGLLHRFNGGLAQARADLGRYLDLAPAGFWRDEAQRQLAAIEGEA